MVFQKISRLCLCDLSAAFGTINHNILITRLSSWFGFTRVCLTCLIDVLVLNVTLVSLPLIPAPVLFLVLFFSSCIPLHLALSSLRFL